VVLSRRGLLCSQTFPLCQTQAVDQYKISLAAAEKLHAEVNGDPHYELDRPSRAKSAATETNPTNGGAPVESQVESEAQAMAARLVTRAIELSAGDEDSNLEPSLALARRLKAETDSALRESPVPPPVEAALRAILFPLSHPESVSEDLTQQLARQLEAEEKDKAWSQFEERVKARARSNPSRDAQVAWSLFEQQVAQSERDAAVAEKASENLARKLGEEQRLQQIMTRLPSDMRRPPPSLSVARSQVPTSVRRHHLRAVDTSAQMARIEAEWACNSPGTISGTADGVRLCPLDPTGGEFNSIIELFKVGGLNPDALVSIVRVQVRHSRSAGNHPFFIRIALCDAAHALFLSTSTTCSIKFTCPRSH